MLEQMRVTITASNANGTSTETVTLNFGDAGNYQRRDGKRGDWYFCLIIALLRLGTYGTTAVYSASNLPAGMTVNSALGLFLECHTSGDTYCSYSGCQYSLWNS